jgi:polar amino acid transport system substrate-binding protein
VPLHDVATRAAPRRVSNRTPIFAASKRYTDWHRDANARPEGMSMRAIRLVLASSLAAASLTATVLTGSLALNSAGAATSLATCKTTISSHVYSRGKLTVATDSPAYTPWFVNNRPTNGKGYESAVVYAIAKVLGIRRANVVWVVEPFDSSYVPGVKKFDFDINEISYTAERASAVSFSQSYYDVQQSIVALKTNPIVTKHTAKELKSYLYGDQIGTTGLAYINDHIKPTRSARVYSTLDQAVAALQAKQIDAIVIDTPTGQYMASGQILNKKKQPVATQVGQFPSVGEHYGLLFAKNSPLVSCINTAIATLKSNGTLSTLQNKWLGLYTGVPTIKP